MKLKSGKYGHFYSCSNWPMCDILVGCHPDTTNPLGTPADQKTRDWRIKAHEAFDSLWKDKEMTRKDAYQWMKTAMGVQSKDAHIGMFDLEMCKKLTLLANIANIESEKGK